jgi:hypothetical protein
VAEQANARAKTSIYNKTANYVPKVGDVLIRLECCDAGPRLVMKVLADAYKCQACKQHPRKAGTVILDEIGWHRG